MSGAAQETESLIISLVKNSKQLTPLSHVRKLDHLVLFFA